MYSTVMYATAMYATVMYTTVMYGLPGRICGARWRYIVGLEDCHSTMKV
jgi:hypothetical protein